MADNDTHLGEFETQHDSDQEQAEQEAAEAAAKQDQAPQDMVGQHPPARTPGQIRREASYFDREIRPGDTVRDLWGGGWMIVFQRKADTVSEYDRMQDDTNKSLLEYEGNKAMGSTEEDAVWQCFYLNKNNTLAGGRSGPYSFPESRICRYAYEATDGWKAGRFQDQIILDALAAVAQAFPGFSGKEDEAATLFDAISLAFDEQMAEDAFELAEAADGGDNDEA